MNEVRFTCPFCTQHIACDDGYAGTKVQCPACLAGLLIPARIQSGVCAVARAASPPMRLYAAPGNERLWTKDQWDRHVAILEGTPADPPLAFITQVVRGLGILLFAGMGGACLLMAFIYLACSSFR